MQLTTLLASLFAALTLALPNYGPYYRNTGPLVTGFNNTHTASYPTATAGTVASTGHVYYPTATLDARSLLDPSVIPRIMSMAPFASPRPRLPIPVSIPEEWRYRTAV
ncbi:MAG: hypothetical protein Q9204_005433 [Flavoplaca sp. TL-2023a]